MWSNERRRRRQTSKLLREVLLIRWLRHMIRHLRRGDIWLERTEAAHDVLQWLVRLVLQLGVGRGSGRGRRRFVYGNGWRRHRRLFEDERGLPGAGAESGLSGVLRDFAIVCRSLRLRRLLLFAGRPPVGDDLGRCRRLSRRLGLRRSRGAWVRYDSSGLRLVRCVTRRTARRSGSGD
jgi:hypothetical protein